MRYTRLLHAALAFSAATFACATSRAALVAYHSFAPFAEALVNENVIQETYESVDVNTVVPDGGALNGLTYDFSNGLDGRVDDTYANLGSRGLAAERDGLPGAGSLDFFFPGESITVSLPFFTRAFGVYISSAVADSMDYSISVAGQGSVASGGTYDPDVAPAPFYFVGLISDTPFLQATISASVLAGGGYTIDDITVIVPGEGDVNGDGVVDIFDINLVSSHWGETGPLGDANGDTMVDIFDINLISSNWTGGAGNLGNATAVPEPATLCLLLLGVGMLLVCERNGRVRFSGRGYLGWVPSLHWR